MDEFKRFFYIMDQTNSSKSPSYGFAIFMWTGIAHDGVAKKKQANLPNSKQLQKNLVMDRT